MLPNKPLFIVIIIFGIIGLTVLLTGSFESIFFGHNLVFNSQLYPIKYKNQVYMNTDDVYSQRLDTITTACKRQHSPQINHLDIERLENNLKVDLKHRIIYCGIAKVGSTFWLRTLTAMIMSSKDNAVSPFSFRRSGAKLSDIQTIKRNLNESQIKHFLETSIKFMFARDPYARLFSGYENKIYQPNALFWKNIGRQVVKEIRINAAHASLLFGHDVTFAEFVKYILKQSENNKPINPHYKPMHLKCDPCKIPFNFIGKLETFHDDTEFLMNKWNTQYQDINVTMLNDFGKEQAINTAVSHVRFMFGAKRITDKMDYPFYKLVLRTWSDLQIRGFLSKDIPLPIKNNNETKLLTPESLTRMISDALDIPVDKVTVKQQREEALVQAYQTVPLDDMERLRLFVLKDCELFGYDDRPAKLFDRTLPFVTEQEHLYMAGL